MKFARSGNVHPAWAIYVNVTYPLGDTSLNLGSAVQLAPAELLFSSGSALRYASGHH